ncbi:hypothetical protein SBRCBS47491_008635 [Sporothrix bragantina]|uniref:Uncharacterized protein n=1 Tax=Sporothrix bragantina TaxID=671064 RepID=A0ABP0CQY6_9PEZI
MSVSPPSSPSPSSSPEPELEPEADNLPDETNETTSSTAPLTDTAAFSATTDELWELLLREQATNAVLQRQIDAERRLRLEAEDIIDQRQDEVYERDAELKRLREERRVDRKGDADKDASQETTAEPSSSTTTAEIKDNPPADDIPDISAGYAALIASVKTFVERQLGAVFALSAHELDAAVVAIADATASHTGYVMHRPRTLLKLMNPRARMFLRLRGADSVHFNAILLEFLRRHVFAEPYGGIFKVATGPVPVSPAMTVVPSPSSRVTETTTPRVMSRIEARLTEVDELAARMGTLLSALDGGLSATPSLIQKNRDPSSSSPSSANTRQPPRPPRHSHSMSDRTLPRPSSSSSPSSSSQNPQSPSSRGAVPIHREARLLRAQLLDRVLSSSARSSSSRNKPWSPVTIGLFSSSSSSSSSLSVTPAHLAPLHRHIDARVFELSAVLVQSLLPLSLALADASQQASPTKKDPSLASTERSKIFADLERAISHYLVRPAVQLAVQMQLSRHVYDVRWVAHAQDSPSLSVCEALGMDYKRIQFRRRTRSQSRDSGEGGGGDDNARHSGKDAPEDDNDERQYSFVFDVSPALFVTKIPLQDTPLTRPALLYAQGVLLQKGEVLTDKTFVHWLHETRSKAKPAALPERKKWAWQ